jgi:magnesium-transporting ATPase (P-type)
MTVFGSILNSDPVATIVVLVVTLIVLFVLGHLVIPRLHASADNHGYRHIVNSLVTSMMQLGLLSFGLFLFDPANYGDSHLDFVVGQAFDFVHIVILFLMIVFVFEAVVLWQVRYFICVLNKHDMYMTCVCMLAVLFICQQVLPRSNQHGCRHFAP